MATTVVCDIRLDKYFFTRIYFLLLNIITPFTIYAYFRDLTEWYDDLFYEYSNILLEENMHLHNDDDGIDYSIIGNLVTAGRDSDVDDEQLFKFTHKPYSTDFHKTLCVKDGPGKYRDWTRARMLLCQATCRKLYSPLTTYTSTGRTITIYIYGMCKERLLKSKTLWKRIWLRCSK